MELNKIHLGDCYELIKQIPDKSVDLVYTDIPYLIVDGGKGAGFLKNETRNKTYEKTIGKFADGINYEILDEFCRVCKKIYCYIWCSKEQIPDLLNYFIAKGCTFNILVWCKTNSTPFVNNTWLPNLEYCLFFREKGAVLNNGVELKSKWFVQKTNVADKKEFVHPTIKPLELVKKHILHSTQPNDVVLDPFMGSGTTAVACKETGRQFIGFEIDEKYWNIANDRLNGINAQGQMSLLDTDFDKVQETYEQMSLFEEGDTNDKK